MEVRKITGQSDTVSIFVMEETGMLRLKEASRSPVTKMALK